MRKNAGFRAVFSCHPRMRQRSAPVAYASHSSRNKILCALNRIRCHYFNLFVTGCQARRDNLQSSIFNLQSSNRASARRASARQASSLYADASHTQIWPFPLWLRPPSLFVPSLQLVRRCFAYANLAFSVVATTPALLTLFYSHWLPF